MPFKEKTMADPYRIDSGTDGAQGNSRGAGVTRARLLRGVLWLLLVLSAAGNSVASFAHVGTAVHLALGGSTAFCVTALVVQYLRRAR
jgi:hypothetical protein